MAVGASRRTHPHPLGPTEVASSARRRIQVAEVPPESSAPTLRLVRVLDDRPHAAGILAAQHLEAAAESPDPLDELVVRHRRMHAPILDPLADAGLDQRRHERARGTLRHARREGELLDVGVALLAGPGRQRAAESTEE